MNVSGAAVGLAVGLVFIVLVFGVVNMLRGGDPSRSQKLMRWRVLLQAGALALILVVLWLRGVRPEGF
jgi:multisubunit Na+/H+ antiporter MnhB subunit